MRSRGTHGTYVALIAMLTGFAAAAPAAGPSFSGYFDTGDPSYAGEDVWVTVTVELVNRSAGDVSDLTVTVEGIGDPSGWGQIWIGDVSDDAVARESGDIVVPDWAYDGWEQGAQPRFRIDYIDAGGKAATAWIEMLYLPLEEG